MQKFPPHIKSDLIVTFNKIDQHTRIVIALDARRESEMDNNARQDHRKTP